MNLRRKSKVPVSPACSVETEKRAAAANLRADPTATGAHAEEEEARDRTAKEAKESFMLLLCNGTGPCVCG